MLPQKLLVLFAIFGRDKRTQSCPLSSGNKQTALESITGKESDGVLAKQGQQPFREGLKRALVD